MHFHSVSRPREIEPNNFLENPEILLKGKIAGPEHILEKDGKFFASLTDGTVVKIVGEKVEVLSQFGKYCSEYRRQTSLRDSKEITIKKFFS